jgi:polyvinyl alcohol dehydrogenase (cytochrome)
MMMDIIRNSAPVRPFRLTALAAAVAAMCATGSTVATAPLGAPAAQQWPMAGQGIDDDHFQPAEQAISPANVRSLVPKWKLTTAGAISATPTVYDGAVYVPDTGGQLWAASASGGRVLWSRSIASYTGVPGDLSRTSPAVYGSELILGDWPFFSATAPATVFAVNQDTGQLMWSTVVDSSPASLITGSPVVAGGVVYVGVSSKEETLAAQPGYSCCTFRGAVAALSATTGQILWKTYTVPSNDSGGDTNSPGAYSGAAVWGSTPAVDPERGLLYVGTGNNYTVPPGVCTAPGQTGCAHPASDDYADSILALNLRTGAVAWADHTLSSDVWTIARPVGPDFDFGSGPNLFITTNPATGQREQLLGIGQKSGVFWAVDPATGRIVWQTQVGPGGPSGGILWGSATDGDRIYVAEADSTGQPYTLGGSGPAAGRTITGGSWAALDAATGKILWQAPDPQGAADTGFVSAANGVVYAGSSAATGTNMYALEARTGKILWSFASGGSVSGGAAVVSDTLYWGSGYCGGPCQQAGQPPVNNNLLYAFTPG